MVKTQVKVSGFPEGVEAYLGKCEPGDRKIAVHRIKRISTGEKSLSTYVPEKLFEDIGVALVCVPEDVRWWKVQSTEIETRRYDWEVVARDEEEAGNMMRMGDGALVNEEFVDGEIDELDAWEIDDPM